MRLLGRLAILCLIVSVMGLPVSASTPNAALPFTSAAKGTIYVASATTTVGSIVVAELYIDITTKLDDQPYGAETDMVMISMKVEFDPSLLRLVDATGQPALWMESCSGTGWDSIQYGIGGPDNFWLGIAAHNPGQTCIARLHFLALDEGVTSLRLSDYEYVYLPPEGTGGPIAASTGTITINPAPVTDRILFGTVIDEQDAPASGALLTLYRSAGDWITQATGASGSDGVFRLWTSPIPGEYQLVMTPPQGMVPITASLPLGVVGSVAGLDTLAFTLDDTSADVGPFLFQVAPLPTPQPTVPVPGVGGWVWLDANGDDTRQPREGLAGCELSLISDDPLDAVHTTATDAEGYYEFLVANDTYSLTLHDPLGRVPDCEREVILDGTHRQLDWGWRKLWLPMLGVPKSQG